MLTKVLYLLKLNKINCSNNLTIFFQTNIYTMRLNRKHFFLFLLIFALTNLSNAQEAVKLTFFKSGIVEYRSIEPFGAKVSDKSLIALMVYVKNANPANCQTLGVNLSNKIALVESGDCGVVQVAQAAQAAGASAVIVIDRKGEKIDIKTPILKIPCLKVEEGTGTFYAQKSEKPVLVCLSGSMYDGKVVAGEAPKVRSVSLDEDTRLALQIPRTSSGSLASVRSDESTVRPIEVPDLNDTTGVETSIQSGTVASLATPAASDFTAKGKSVVPQTQPTVVAPTPSTAPKAVVPAPPTPQIVPQATPQNLATMSNKEEGNADFRAQFEVYPRRVSEILAVSYNLEKRSNLKITLFDAAGKPVIERNFENALADFMEFDVLKMNSGNYKLLIVNDIGKATYEISIQH